MNDLEPLDFATADYRTVLRRLTTLDDDAAGMRDEASAWHEEQIAAADQAVRDAEMRVLTARREAVESRRAMEEVDARAAELWLEYVHKVGPAAERFGRTPPQPSIPRQRGERNATEYLDEVANKVKYVPPARPITGPVKILFTLFGLISGIIGVIVYHALDTAAGPAAVRQGTWKDALPVIALLALLACPVVAAIAAKRIADRRSTGLETSTVVTILLTGLATAGILLAATKLHH